MSRIHWLNDDEKLVQGGLDRGVLYPSESPAVAWNGLVSITESGSQEATNYYMNGRRYLTAVSAREYSATLSAVTFPDEFADICGIVEAADGLFLDSQIPDQFGLSYRTGYSGDKYYKIHIVYGATAAISDTEYQTISGGSNDPTNFEFEISAVPQPIPGFRPTAHVIIDSRHVNDDLLIKIENMLYGNYGSEPQLPSIPWLYETTNWGDFVIITDNGDGSWTAVGSHKNVETHRDGSFSISNATIKDHNDGTYELASTSESIANTDIDGGTISSTDPTIVDGNVSGSVIDGGSV